MLLKESSNNSISGKSVTVSLYQVDHQAITVTRARSHNDNVAVGFQYSTTVFVAVVFQS